MALEGNALAGVAVAISLFSIAALFTLFYLCYRYCNDPRRKNQQYGKYDDGKDPIMDDNPQPPHQHRQDVDTHQKDAAPVPTSPEVKKPVVKPMEPEDRRKHMEQKQKHPQQQPEQSPEKNLPFSVIQIDPEEPQDTSTLGLGTFIYTNPNPKTRHPRPSSPPRVSNTVNVKENHLETSKSTSSRDTTLLSFDRDDGLILYPSSIGGGVPLTNRISSSTSTKIVKNEAKQSLSPTKKDHIMSSPPTYHKKHYGGQHSPPLSPKSKSAPPQHHPSPPSKKHHLSPPLAVTPEDKPLPEINLEPPKDSPSVMEESQLTSDTMIDNIIAPPGKLGIILRDGASGTYVHEIRNDSPLNGQIFPRDRIYSVDGKDVSAMSVKEINDVIMRSSHQRRMLTVRRPNESVL